MNYFEQFHAPHPRASEISEELLALAQEYHTRTETFDRTVCTGPIRRGAILPANDLEFVQINRHANRVRKELTEKAECLGFTGRQFKYAMMVVLERERLS